MAAPFVRAGLAAERFSARQNAMRQRRTRPCWRPCAKLVGDRPPRVFAVILGVGHIHHDQATGKW